jgi:hypothetical protein
VGKLHSRIERDASAWRTAAPSSCQDCRRPRHGHPCDRHPARGALGVPFEALPTDRGRLITTPSSTRRRSPRLAHAAGRTEAKRPTVVSIAPALRRPWSKRPPTAPGWSSRRRPAGGERNHEAPRGPRAGLAGAAATEGAPRAAPGRHHSPRPLPPTARARSSRRSCSPPILPTTARSRRARS